MEASDEGKKWCNFIDKLADGGVPSSKFYVLEDHLQPLVQEGSASPKVELVTPTEQQVKQAQMQLKRNLVNSSRVRKFVKMKPKQKSRLVKNIKKTKPKSKPKSKKPKVSKKRKIVKRARKKKKF